MAFSDAPVSKRTFIGSGDLLINLFDSDGNLTAYEDVGNATAFTQSAPSVDKIEVKGRRRDNAGNIIASSISGVGQEFQVEIHDLTRRNLLLNMLADSEAYTQTAANNTATPETITAYLGKWVDLSNRRLDSANPPVVQDAATETTTYVEGTDYEIDYLGGMLFALSTGSITDAESLKVGSTWLEIADGIKIKGLSNLSQSGKCKLFVKNEHTTDVTAELIIYNGLIEPAGDTSWLSEDTFASITLKITAQDKDGDTYDFIEY